MNAEQHEWYWKGYNDAKNNEKLHPMMDMPHDQKIAMAYGKLQQRTWVGLTNKERHAVTRENPTPSSAIVWFKAIEAKLKEKNT